MTILDTHIWIWWVHESPSLPIAHRHELQRRMAERLGVSIISCWEVAKLVEVGRLTLPLPIDEWIEKALSYPELELLPITPAIAVGSTQLPGDFHRDPADQLIVATARLFDADLMTCDDKILNYPHVRLAIPSP
jgi:PIN domain nuclease of toxin-antitoxin system